MEEIYGTSKEVSNVWYRLMVWSIWSRLLARGAPRKSVVEAQLRGSWQKPVSRSRPVLRDVIRALGKRLADCKRAWQLEGFGFSTVRYDIA